MINQGDATFVDETDARLSGPQTGEKWIRAIVLSDLDRDGDLDLLTQVNGLDARLLPVYVDDGNGFFAPLEVAHHIVDSRNWALLDIDEDGRPDIISSVGTWEGDPEQHYLIGNTGC